MAELDLQIKSEAIEYMTKEVLAKIPTEIDDMTIDNVDVLTNNLYVLKYYCSQKNFDPDVISRLDNLIETSQGLWELLDSNSNTFMYLKEMYTIRRLDLVASLIGQYEETTSGEETFRDFVLSSVATFIGWKSDTIWIDVAKIDHYAPSRTHVRRLRDEFWRLISDSPRNGDQITLEKAVELGEKMSLLLKLMVSDEFPAPGRALLLATIYTMLLRLQIDKTIVAMQSNGE
ncbi:MAG: hypothetical protein QG588_137 [Candidatus Poribacteria bacterium]|nr:hypothetical protein [Candidatus Poribacteria bacterium]